MDAVLRTGRTLVRALVLAGSVATLVLVRTPIPVELLALAVALSLGALYLVERERSGFRLWALYVLGFTLFAHLRTLADETGIAFRVDYAIDAERWLFAGTVPSAWLQERLYDPGAVGAAAVIATAVHLSYFVTPHLLAFALWKVSAARFRRYALELLTTAYVGLTVSFLVPTAPPWLAAQLGDLSGVHRVLQEVGTDVSPEAYRQGYEIAGTNPVAAMPSLHMAITAIVVVSAWRLNRSVGLVASLYGLAMAFSLVFSGEHYAVDILAGLLTAGAGLGLVRLAERLRPRVPAPLGWGIGQRRPAGRSLS